MKTRVLLVDDHQMFRQAIRQVLAMTDNIEVVGEAGDGTEAERKALELHPDIVLMDLGMPRTDGITATERISEKMPQARIIVVTGRADDEHLFQALRAGAQGYVLKTAPVEQLLRAIAEARSGLNPLDATLSTRVLSEFRRLVSKREPEANPDGLTKREIEILRMVAAGRTNREIAANLYIAEKTVKNYLTNIFQKIGASDRVQAALYAHRHELLTDGERALLGRNSHEPPSPAKDGGSDTASEASVAMEPLPSNVRRLRRQRA